MNQLSFDVIRIDGGTQPRAALNEEYIDELVQALGDGATLPPIIVFYDGSVYWLADGFHRYHATKRLYQKAIQADIRQGTRRDAVLFSVGANAQHGLRRTNTDKRRAVETLLNDPEWAKWTDREIARKCGVHHQLVGTLRPQFSLDDSSSERTYINKYGDVATMNTANIGRTSSNVIAGFGRTLTELDESPTLPILPVVPVPLAQPKIDLHQWKEDNLVLGLDRFGDVIEEEIEEASPVVVEVTEHPQQASESVFSLPVVEYSPVLHTPPAQSYRPIVEPAIVSRGVPPALQMSESNEWYTPAPYVEAARELMGGIDIDPASNALANQVIQATTYHDIETNGLEKPWHGRVWLNPPYGMSEGRSNQEIWTQHLIQQFVDGIAKEAVLLVNANTEAKWFQPLYDYLICFTNHRIRFYNANGTPNQPTQGNALVYFGTQRQRFIELFRQFGRIEEEAKIDVSC